MIMSENTNNYLRWIVVIGLLFIPPFLVHGSADGGTIRIIVYCILICVITLLGAYLAFKQGDIVSGMPIDKHLKSEKSRRAGGTGWRWLAAPAQPAGRSPWRLQSGNKRRRASYGDCGHERRQHGLIACRNKHGVCRKHLHRVQRSSAACL